jgi:hypothetical protein
MMTPDMQGNSQETTMVQAPITTEAEARDWLRRVLHVDDVTMARLARLVDLLVEENERQNLIARGTIPMVWQRHIVDSAQLLAVPRETLPEGSWLDLGTGAGFPGLVIAALQPERPVTLVDRVVCGPNGSPAPRRNWGLPMCKSFWHASKTCRINSMRCFRRALLRRWTSFLRFLRVFPHRKRCGCCQKGRRLRRNWLYCPKPGGTCSTWNNR